MPKVIQVIKWKGWDLKSGLFDPENQGINHHVILPLSRKVSFYEDSVRSFPCGVSQCLTLWFASFNSLLLLLLESTSS